MSMSKTYWFGKILLHTILKVFFRFRFSGQEKFPAGGAIIASNHASFLDPPIIGVAAPHEICYLARETLFRNIFASALYKKLGAIPIKRDAADPRSVRTIIEKLSRGNKIVMFPEGSRTRDGELQKAKPGLGFIICKAQVPVIPTYIHGTFEALPRHRAVIHFPKIIGTFGKPLIFNKIWAGKASRDDYERIGDIVMQAIAELKESVLKSLR